MSDEALNGPYETSMGRDAYGHKVNNFGRCQYLNEDPANCPRIVEGEPESIWDPETEPDGRD